MAEVKPVEDVRVVDGNLGAEGWIGENKVKSAQVGGKPRADGVGPRSKGLILPIAL